MIEQQKWHCLLLLATSVARAKICMFLINVQWTGKACESDGIMFEVRECDKMDLEDKLKEAIDDPKVHGIMIYYPCFGGAPSFYGGNMDDYLRDSVPIEKDVEGLCDTVSYSA
jgi:5,10-methylene-tetrahydrofolate dehydrogenase/methenyl tetrahydrofolate cyclohydrolase